MDRAARQGLDGCEAWPNEPVLGARASGDVEAVGRFSVSRAATSSRPHEHSQPQTRGILHAEPAVQVFLQGSVGVPDLQARPGGPAGDDGGRLLAARGWVPTRRGCMTTLSTWAACTAYRPGAMAIKSVSGASSLGWRPNEQVTMALAWSLLARPCACTWTSVVSPCFQRDRVAEKC